MLARSLVCLQTVLLIVAASWCLPAFPAQPNDQAPSRGLYNTDAYAKARRALAGGDVEGAMKGFCDMFVGADAVELWTVSAILLCDPSQLRNYMDSIEKLQPVFVQARQLQGQWCYRICAGVTRDRKEAVRWRALLPGPLLAEGPFPVLISHPCEQASANVGARSSAVPASPQPPVAATSPPPKTQAPSIVPPAPSAQEAPAPKISPAKHAEGEAWFQKGLAAQSKEKRGEARECYQRALEAEPNRPEVLNNLGVLYLQENRYDKAKLLFDQALQNSPAYARAHLNLAGALWGLGDRDAATMEARKAVALDATDVSGHLTLASFLLAQDEKDQAAAEAKRALLLEPTNAQARALLSTLARPDSPGSKP